MNLNIASGCLLPGQRREIYALIEKAAYEADGDLFVAEDDFEEPIAADSRWTIQGDVADVERQGGWVRARTDDANPESMLVGSKRLLAIADSAGRAPDPFLRLAARVFVVPDPVDDSASQPVFGMVDMGHGPRFFAVLAGVFNFPPPVGPAFFQWVLIASDGVQTSVVPTGVRPSKSCAAPDLFDAVIRPEVAYARLNGRNLPVVPIVTGFWGHLYARGFSAQQGMPGGTGEIHVDWSFAAQGRLCAED